MSHVVPDVVRKIQEEQDPLHVLGDGSQTRHYTYGADLAKGIVLTLDHTAAMNEDFNLSTAHETKVKKLAEEIWTKINGEGQPLRLVHVEPFEPDLQRRSPSTL